MTNKDKIKKKVGRPSNSDNPLTDYQRQMKNGVLKYTTPLFPKAVEALAVLGGIAKADTSSSLEVTTKESTEKKESVPATVRNGALITLTKMHMEAIKAVYGADRDGRVSKDFEDEEEEKPKTVAKLELVYNGPDEDNN